MMKGNWKQVIEIAGIFSVVGSLLLVALELNQNNELMEAEARYNRLNVWSNTLSILLDDPELLELNYKTELTEPENRRLRNYYRLVFLGQEWSFKEIEPTELPLVTWRNLASNPHSSTFWEDLKSEFDSEFAQFMDMQVYK